MDARAFLAALAAAEVSDDVISRHRARCAGLDDAAVSRLAARGLWRRLHRGVFWTQPQDGQPPLRTRLTAARLAAGNGLAPEGVVVGRSACELWQLPLLDAPGLTELVVAGAHRRARPGLCVRRTELAATDVTQRHGFPVTTPRRTVRDAAARRSFADALVLADAARRLRLVGADELRQLTGLGRPAARAMAAADPRAESPFESRVRAELITARVPPPVLQHVITDHGRFVARVDLAWPQLRLAVEADGASVHASADALRADLRRQNLIVAAHWQLLRFTWADLGRIASIVRAALSSRATFRAA
jgi:very-short-patch-repair endonuclease